MGTQRRLFRLLSYGKIGASEASPARQRRLGTEVVGSQAPSPKAIGKIHFRPSQELKCVEHTNVCVS